MKPIHWLILFFSIFGVYLMTAAPAVPPYRDAGEMTSVLNTLGVAHPPGYPLYILVGQISNLLPFGNYAYKVNVFSALMGSLAVVLFISLLRAWITTPAAILAGLFFGFSKQFWELSLVPEMYTFGILMLILVLYSFFVLQNIPLTCFIFGLSLGVRMDLLLLGPILFIFIWPKRHSISFVKLGIFFGLGLSIFLYLWVRSKTDPVLDWGNPETLKTLFNSIRRKSYGGTLDLLSTNYGVGENFGANIYLYGSQVIRDFTWFSPLLILLGGWFGFRRKRSAVLFLWANFFVFGPFFLFLANMPPNPHAVAIVEANYLVPQLFLAAILGFGIHFLFNWKVGKWVPLFILCVAVCLNSYATGSNVCRRNNFYVQDYIENTIRSVPPGRPVVFHEDVQLFSFWDFQLVQKKRLDMPVIATGLSSSPWYWTMKNRWPAKVVPGENLKLPGAFEKFSANLNGTPFFVGYETPYTGGNSLMTRGHGLVLEVASPKNPGALSKMPLQDLGVFRGTYVYEQTPDFFSSDLITDLARAHHRIGFDSYAAQNFEKAEWHFRRAESLDPVFVRPTLDRGLIYYQQGNYERALQAYLWAIEKGEELRRRSLAYNSLPDVRQGILENLSNSWVNAGVAWEKLGKLKEAQGAYLRSIEAGDNFQAHYNLAVSFWNRDWNQVIVHLEQASKLKPNDPNVLGYLMQARRNIKS